MDESEKVLKALRGMAWERAKGELNAILETFWGNEVALKKLDALVGDFIDKIEDKGYVD